ncbi:hypothetical protein X777_04758 [Ooceraea biroi]|uniref:Uncharacterized protein n=1 Tax=Ooceraea biroi TaxID=2015173 RepID=A0A026WK28_OOCBI|nr:hypothetical protein X777_04758 [Ooceraea biroi]
MYFAHGLSVAYNYAVCRNMFARGTELASQLGGMIRLRALIDNTDTLHYPIFASDIPVRHLACLSFVWKAQTGLPHPSELQQQEDEDAMEQLLVRYMVALYAGYAYSYQLIHPTLVHLFDVSSNIRCFFAAHHSLFTADRLVKLIKRWRPRSFPVTIARAVQADYIANAMLDPQTPFATIVLASMELRGSSWHAGDSNVCSSSTWRTTFRCFLRVSATIVLASMELRGSPWHAGDSNVCSSSTWRTTFRCFLRVLSRTEPSRTHGA